MRPIRGIEFRLPGNIHTLHRLIHYQQFGFTQQGTGQQYTLVFTTGEGLHRRSHKMPDLQLCYHALHSYGRVFNSQIQEAGHGKGQILRQCQTLGHVADMQTIPSCHPTGIRL